LLTLVPTPIGNLGDITVRALERLQEAHHILAEDTRVAKSLLRLLGQRHGIQWGHKYFHSFHEHNQREFLERVSPSFFQQQVVYMSDAGMPGVSDPGAKLVAYAQNHGISYEVLPGPSAAITAWAASGYEGRFTFFGFLPHKKGRQRELREVMAHPYHSILYEAPHRLLKLLGEMEEIDPERELFLAKELTKLHQSFFRGSVRELLEELSSQGVRGEWVVIVTPDRRERREIDPDLLYSLDLPKKQKAKLIAQLTGGDVKEIYEKLIDN